MPRKADIEAPVGEPDCREQAINCGSKERARIDDAGRGAGGTGGYLPTLYEKVSGQARPDRVFESAGEGEDV